ncbi:hypothetical protein C2845_PM03G20090 [Panicum miliaceum]|uniref:CCHC-type domain-containing protein n=1 Tax=Panicum miliaceum TaxID=4540 RepID=A0A3L6T9I3_PANMI|nr:hypothetical protein C2845_PM03G20090 [Panicum miliaceum]
MHPKLLKQVKIMNKSLKKINMTVYMVFLKDGQHHQLMKVEKIKYKKEKKQKKKEKKSKHEAFATFGEWKNDELKQEVERLMRDLAKLKAKNIVQPSQDNREDMVKKLEKGATVTYFNCHQEGHKYYKCPQPKKKLPDDKNKKNATIKSSLIYTKPNRKNKNKSTTYVIKKKNNGRVVAHKCDLYGGLLVSFSNP